MNKVNAPHGSRSYKILTRVRAVYGTSWTERPETFNTRPAAEAELEFILKDRPALEGGIQETLTILTFNQVTFNNKEN